MKIRDILNKDTATISFEVFPPKKSTDFGNVEAAALGIAALQPAYMSVTYGAGGSTKGHTIPLLWQERFRSSTMCLLWRI